MPEKSTLKELVKELKNFPLNEIMQELKAGRTNEDQCFLKECIDDYNL